MKAMFANLTAADFSCRSRHTWRAMERKRVLRLFDDLQVAIHKQDRAAADSLLAKLAIATGHNTRALHDL
jgi:hypothetical protein